MISENLIYITTFYKISLPWVIPRQPTLTATIGKNTIPLFSTFGLDMYAGKELELVGNATMEDLLAVVENMTEKVRPAHGYSEFMSKENGFISGILMWELTWRGNEHWIPDAVEAVRQFRSMIKIKS